MDIKKLGTHALRNNLINKTDNSVCCKGNFTLQLVKSGGRHMPLVPFWFLHRCIQLRSQVKNSSPLMIWPPIISRVDIFCLFDWPFEKYYKANYEGKVPVVSQMRPVQIERRAVCDLCAGMLGGSNKVILQC